MVGPRDAKKSKQIMKLSHLFNEKNVANAHEQSAREIKAEEKERINIIIRREEAIN